MWHNGKFCICVSFYIVFSTFLFEPSSSKTIVCREPHISIRIPKQRKPINVTGLEISISFESEEFQTRPKNYALLHLKDTEIFVQASIISRKLNESIQWNSTRSDETGELKRKTISALASYNVSNDSDVSLNLCNAWLSNPDNTLVNADRLKQENKDYGKYSKFIHKSIMAKIKECVSTNICAEVKDRVTEEYTKKIPEQPEPEVIEDETEESVEEVSSDSKETSEEEVEKVIKVDKKRATSSICKKLNDDGLEDSQMGHIVSLPVISLPHFTFKNGSLGELQRIRIHDAMKVTDLERGVRIIIPLVLPTAIAHYEFEYLKPSSIEYPKEVIVYTENMMFEVVLFVKKSGEKCESTIEKLKTIHPGEITNVIDQSTEEPVTYPIAKLIENAWEEGIMFVVENELYELMAEKLREIEC